MLTKSYLILFIFSLYTSVQGQHHRYKLNNYVKEDSTIYDISELYLKNDRYPKIFKAGIFGCFGPGSTKHCLAFALKRKLKSVSFESALPQLQVYREGIFRPNKSSYEILLDENGKLLSITKKRHHLKSLPFEEVKSIFETIEWAPALYDLKPVKSKFILKLEFHEDGCKYEYKYNLEIGLNNILKNTLDLQKCMLLYKYDLYCDRDEEYAKQVIKQEEFDALDKKVERIKKLGQEEIERIKIRFQNEMDKKTKVNCHLFAIKVQDEQNAFEKYLKSIL